MGLLCSLILMRLVGCLISTYPHGERASCKEQQVTYPGWTRKSIAIDLAQSCEFMSSIFLLK